jgi:hypothetical protein
MVRPGMVVNPKPASEKKEAEAAQKKPSEKSSRE